MPDSIRRLAGLAMGYSLADGLIRGLSFVLLPLLVTRLSPAEFGLVGALTALATLLTNVLGFGLSGSPVRFYHLYQVKEERAEFLGSAFLSSAGFAALGIATIDAASGPVLDGLGLASLQTGVRLSLWTAWFQVVARTIPLGVLRARDAVGEYLVVSAVAVGATFAMVFLRLARWDQGVIGVLRGSLEGAIATSIVAGVLVSRDIAWRVKRRHVSAAFSYGLPLIPHNISHWVLGLSDRFLVGRLLGATELGYYHFAYQFASAFQLLVSSANSALLPRFAKIGDTPSDASVHSLRRVTSAYLGLALIVGSSIAILAPVAIATFTPDFSAAGAYVPWLVLAVVFFLGYSIPMNVLTMTVGQTAGIWRITAFAGTVSMLLNLTLLPVIGLWGAVIATAISYALLQLGTRSLALRATRLTTRVNPERQFWIASVLSASMVLAVRLSGQESDAQVIFGSAIAAVTAIGVAIIFRRELER